MDGASSVELFVYDLSRGLAKQFSAQLVGTHFEGIWCAASLIIRALLTCRGRHTGIVVYGREYFYGGGLQAMMPVRTSAARKRLRSPRRVRLRSARPRSGSRTAHSPPPLTRPQARLHGGAQGAL